MHFFKAHLPRSPHHASCGPCAPLDDNVSFWTEMWYLTGDTHSSCAFLLRQSISSFSRWQSVRIKLAFVHIRLGRDNPWGLGRGGGGGSEKNHVHTLLPMASVTSSSWFDLSARRGPDPWPWTQLWPEGVILPSMTAQTSWVRFSVNSREWVMMMTPPSKVLRALDRAPSESRSR